VPSDLPQLSGLSACLVLRVFPLPSPLSLKQVIILQTVLGYLFPLDPPIRESRKSAINYVLFGFCCSLLFVSFIGLGYKFLVDSFHLSKSFHFLGAWWVFYDFLGPLLWLNCDWEGIISFFSNWMLRKFIDKRIDTRPVQWVSQSVTHSIQQGDVSRQLTCHSRRVCQFRILVTVFCWSATMELSA